MNEELRSGGISVFFPAYNDEKSIVKLVEDAISVLEKLTDNYEVIIVDDASYDNTGRIANELALKNSRIKVIRHTSNQGYGGALRSGFMHASKELIFYTDGDGQYDVQEITSLLSAMGDNTDVVNGYKIQRNDPLYRIIIGQAYLWIVRRFFNLRIKDISCDFRLFRRAIFDKVKLRCNSGAICVEMIKKIQDARLAIIESPVHHYARQYGHSQFFNFSNLFKMLRELTGLWLEQFKNRG